MKEFDDEKIDAFLDEKLPDNERIIFESAIQNDPKLAKKVHTFKMERAAVDELLYRDFKKEIETWGEPGGATSAPPRVVPMRRLMLYAASFLVLIGAGATWHASQNYSDATLVSSAIDDNYFEMIDPGRAGGKIDNFIKGTDAFHGEKNYEKAIEFFSKVKPEDQLFSKSQQYIALANFHAENYKEAESEFDALFQKTSETKYQWFSILSKFRQEIDIRPDLERLLDDSATDPVIREKAIELKGNLDSGWRNLVLWK